MIQTMTLLPGITLRCFPDSRFKQSCLSIQLVRPLAEEEAAMNALIPAVLLRGCATAPDLRAITLRLDELYGASVGALVRRVGDYQTTGLHCSFINDRYTMEAEGLLEPMVAFVRQLLLEPVLQDGAFRTDYVESEKKNLISTIESQLNDKRTYATARMLDTMCANDPFGVPRLGRAEQAAKVDAKNLYAHYRKILAGSRIDILYVGEQSPQRLKELLMPMFAGIDRDYCPLQPQTPFRGGKETDQIQTMEVSQGKLVMGFTTPITTRDDDFAAMQVCNTMLGAGMTSKLFMQIREKLSLCYDIGSGYYGSKGILLVSAGIDSKKDALVRQHIMEQVKACQDGDITPQELSAAKEAVCSSLEGTHDSPGAIESYYASGALSALELTPADYIRRVQAVSAEAVAAAARTLHLHTVYFLKGEE